MLRFAADDMKSQFSQEMFVYSPLQVASIITLNVSVTHERDRVKKCVEHVNEILRLLLTIKLG